MIHISISNDGALLTAKLEGQISGRELKTAFEPEFEKALERVNDGKVSLLLVVEGGKALSFDFSALIEDFRLGLNYFFSLHRVAVVGYSQSAVDLVGLFSRIFPFEVEVFASSDLKDAENWVSCGRSEVSSLEFKILKKQNIAILKPRADVSLSSRDLIRVGKLIDAHVMSEKLALKGLLAYVNQLAGWGGIAAMVENFNFIQSHDRSIRKIAIVTDSKIVASVEKVAGIFVHSEVICYPLEQYTEAFAWINEDDI